MLGVEFVRAFLPQTERFVPFAAFFVAICLLLCIPDRTRKTALCLLLGAAAGAAAVYSTNASLEHTRVRYAGRELVLTAEVERTEETFLPGRVEAVLRVETVNGADAVFRVVCEMLPDCEAGELVQGWFVLSAPEAGSQSSRYADGIALEAEYRSAFAVLGQSRSFRACTRRLQKRLSASLRRCMDGKTGGVLAAMTLGDRSCLSAGLRSAYRGAGLSHVLVVSGLHVSILCGEIFGAVLPRRKRERSYRSRRFHAVRKALLALLLAGVTGFTPSVRRAAAAVWISALGVWVYGAPDPLTSLAAAGILMTVRNSYAVLDVGFELSFAAVLGTLAGAECVRRLRTAFARPGIRPGLLRRGTAAVGWYLCETVCISVCASAATFPVLVLRGLSVSLWAVVSGAAVLWLVQPMLLLGLAAAFTGLVPALAPVYIGISKAASVLTGLLNAWAERISTKPGAGLYFDTAYAAVVSLVLIALCWLAMHWKVRLRTALPCILLTAAAAVCLGNALSRDIVHIDLVGSSNAPAVVVSQNGAAVVLLRGGTANQTAVEAQLARRGVTTVELAADLRLSETAGPCTLPAAQWVRADALPAGTVRKLRCTPALVELLRTRNGCLVRLTIGNRQFAALSGTVELAEPVSVQWLLASPAKAAAVRYEKVLALRRYDGLEPGLQSGQELPASLSLRRHGGLKAE